MLDLPCTAHQEVSTPTMPRSRIAGHRSTNQQRPGMMLGMQGAAHLGGPLHPHDSTRVKAEGEHRLRTRTTHPPPVPHPHAAVGGACSRQGFTLAEDPRAWAPSQDQAYRSKWLAATKTY